MRKFFPITMLIAVAIAIAGCTQEADQTQTTGDSSDEVAATESATSAPAIEQTTLKPDASEADAGQEANVTESAESNADSEENDESDETGAEASSDEAP